MAVLVIPSESETSIGNDFGFSHSYGRVSVIDIYMGFSMQKYTFQNVHMKRPLASHHFPLSSIINILFYFSPFLTRFQHNFPFNPLKIFNQHLSKKILWLIFF